MEKYKIEKFEKARLNGINGWSYEVWENKFWQQGWVFVGQFFAKTKKEAKVKWGIK